MRLRVIETIVNRETCWSYYKSPPWGSLVCQNTLISTYCSIVHFKVCEARLLVRETRKNWETQLKRHWRVQILTVYNGSTILISPRSKYKTYVRNHIKIDCFSACLICVHLYCLHYRPIKLCILLKHNSNIYRIMSYICSCLVYVTKLNNRIHFASEIPCNFTQYKIIFRLSWIMVTSWNLSLGNLQSHACLVFKAWKVESNSLSKLILEQSSPTTINTTLRE